MSKNFFESAQNEITRLVILRHGRTAANQTGRIGSLDAYSLDDEGFLQAKRAAVRLMDFPITKIYSSPLLRTRQTSEPISRRLGIPIHLCEELAEYQFGVLSDYTLDELSVANPEAFHLIRDWIAGKSKIRPNLAGMESMTAFRDRIARFTSMVQAEHAGEVVLAVTHMAVIKGMLAYFAGSPFEKPLPYQPDNASISVVDFFCGVPMLRLFNDIHHLDLELRYGRTTII